MNGYELSRIPLRSISNYKKKRDKHWDYSLGGWYMILDVSNGMKYIGKSVEFMFRLKQHLNVKNPKILIDKIIKEKGIECFEYYVLDKYTRHNIDFFSRSKEISIENMLIKSHKSFSPFGYNIKYYE